MYSRKIAQSTIPREEIFLLLSLQDQASRYTVLFVFTVRFLCMMTTWFKSYLKAYFKISTLIIYVLIYLSKDFWKLHTPWEKSSCISRTATLDLFAHSFWSKKKPFSTSFYIYDMVAWSDTCSHYGWGYFRLFKNCCSFFSVCFPSIPSRPL